MATETMSVGFGFSFYGYFACAAIWMVGYFIWTGVASTHDRDESRR
jgi:hypothetical protein